MLCQISFPHQFSRPNISWDWACSSIRQHPASQRADQSDDMAWHVWCQNTKSNQVVFRWWVHPAPLQDWIGIRLSVWVSLWETKTKWTLVSCCSSIAHVEFEVLSNYRWLESRGGNGCESAPKKWLVKYRFPFNIVHAIARTGAPQPNVFGTC